MNEDVTKRDRFGLRFKQAYLAYLLGNPTDARPEHEKAKAAGYHPKYVPRLKRNPNFQKAMEQSLESNKGNARVVAWRELVTAVKRGDVAAIKEILRRVEGEVPEKIQLDANIRGKVDHRHLLIGNITLTPDSSPADVLKGLDELLARINAMRARVSGLLPSGDSISPPQP